MLCLISGQADTLDYPHTAVNNINCDDCHLISGSNDSLLVDVTSHSTGLDDSTYNNLCWGCHNDVDAVDVKTHSYLQIDDDYGEWSVECRTCHNPHTQRQVKIYTTSTYLATGISTSIATDSPEAGKSTLTDTSKSWTDDEFIGLSVIPDVNYRRLGYKILSNTPTTITVEGVFDTTYIASGDTYAVVYGKLIKETVSSDDILVNSPTTKGVGDKTVRFYTDTGTNSFADNNATYDGICEVCHTQTNYHRNDDSGDHSHKPMANCVGCHSHENGFRFYNHTAIGAVLPISTCSIDCHGGGPDPVLDVHSAQCGLCHLNPDGAGPLVEPYETTTPNGGDCTDCHGVFSVVHGSVDHTATPAGDMVVIFADNDHDDAGWIGPTPYFDVYVDCDTCHNVNLPETHGNYANVCTTCHPTPYDSLEGTWNGGCQQGDCHTTFHEDSIPAHWPFGDPYDPGNDCDRCHEQGVGAVVQDNCLYCHSTYGPGNVTPPVTTTNAQASYNGPAIINFSITDGGEVGNGGKVIIGRTFFRLDGGDESNGSSVFINDSAPGSQLHTLEYWSIDQDGHVESPPTNMKTFTIVKDTTPPTTTSNAQASYYQNAQITLTAMDASYLGVKTTYFSLDDGTTVQNGTGTSVFVPGISGEISYTLLFWSEDWSGNSETPNTANFTVTAGTGIFHFNSGELPTDEYWVDWLVWRGAPTGDPDYTISRVGPCSTPCSDYLGVPVTGQQYYVRVAWGDPIEPYDEYDFGYYTVTPDIVIVLE